MPNMGVLRCPSLDHCFQEGSVAFLNTPCEETYGKAEAESMQAEPLHSYVHNLIKPQHAVNDESVRPTGLHIEGMPEGQKPDDIARKILEAVGNVNWLGLLRGCK